MRKRGKLAPAVAAAALFGAACADQAVQPDPGQLAVTADATAAAGTARMAATFTSTMSMDEFTMTMEGVVDFAREATHLTMAATDIPEVGSVSGEVIVLDGFSYIRGDMAPAPDVPEGTWVRHQAPEGAGWWGQPFSDGQPTGMVEALRELGLPVELVGTERVRGVDTTRYQVQATAEDLMRAQHPEAGADIPDILDLQEMQTVIDIWVDSEDLLRRMRTDTDMGSAYRRMMEEEEDVGEARMVMDFELFDFGIDVDITAPPEDEVLDYEPFMVEEPEIDVPPALDIEEAAELEITRPLVAADVPEEFPLHPAATVVDSHGSADAALLELRVVTFGDEQLDQVTAHYEALLRDHGWEIVGRSSAATASPAGEDTQEQILDVAGHGWRGSVTIRETAGSSEVNIVVELERT